MESLELKHFVVEMKKYLFSAYFVSLNTLRYKEQTWSVLQWMVSLKHIILWLWFCGFWKYYEIETSGF